MNIHFTQKHVFKVPVTDTYTVHMISDNHASKGQLRELAQLDLPLGKSAQATPQPQLIAGYLICIVRVGP